MFNKIFKPILQRGLVDKLKEIIDYQLFDPYSILIMIMINDQCKKQMQRVYRLNALDDIISKLSIFVLWPRFSQIFDMHLNNLKTCDVGSFQVNGQIGLSMETTVRAYQFLAGLFRLQDVCQISDQNNMVTQRHKRVVVEIQNLLQRMS